MTGVQTCALPIYVRGDFTRLCQALLNYASNAVKFTKFGTIDVRASVDRQSAGYVVVRFEVQDSGIGIPAAQLARLFTPFTQADASTTRKYGGSGLGLAITKRLVEAMGGEVGAVSEAGFGSTFWFTARLETYAASDDPSEQVATGEETDPANEAILQLNAQRQRVVLLAEDDAFNQEIATLLLEEVGFQVDIADHGEMALAMVGHKRYDLIMMDMQMPVMDGVDATRLIRGLSANPHDNADVPIVAMTANAFAEDRERCLAAGLNDFVTKPVAPDVLYQVILPLLHRHT